MIFIRLVSHSLVGSVLSLFVCVDSYCLASSKGTEAAVVGTSGGFVLVADSSFLIWRPGFFCEVLRVAVSGNDVAAVVTLAAAGKHGSHS